MKRMLLAGLAAVGLGASAISQNVAQADSQNNIRYDKRNQDNKDSQPVQAPERVSKKITNVKHQGYSGFASSNPGIPPKIYGMYHVKRGTHKRTNIKK